MKELVLFLGGVITGATVMALQVREYVQDTKMRDLSDEGNNPNKVTFWIGDEKIGTFSREFQHCKPSPAPEIDWEDELEQPQEVKYGEF